MDMRIKDLKSSSNSMIIVQGGHIHKINKATCRKSFRMNSFPMRCINNWNNLDEDLVYSDSVMNF